MGGKNTSRSLMRPVTGLWMEFDCRLRSYYVQQDMPELRPGLRLRFQFEEVAQGACLNSRRVFLAARAKCTGSLCFIPSKSDSEATILAYVGKSQRS